METEYPPINPAPIIVVGTPRSGTGLVTQFLQALGIYMGGRYMTDNREALTFKDFNRQMLDGFGCTWRNPAYLPTIYQMTNFCDWVVKLYQDNGFRAVLERMFFEFNSASIDRWGWKSPLTSLLLPIWYRIFPEATVIHVQRNSADVARSNVVHDWSREDYNPHYHENGERREWYKRYITLNSFYVDRISSSLDLFDAYYTIFYEDILANPLKEVTELAEFLELPTERLQEVAAIVEPDRQKRRYDSLQKAGILSFTEEEEE